MFSTTQSTSSSSNTKITAATTTTLKPSFGEIVMSCHAHDDLIKTLIVIKDDTFASGSD